MPNMSPNKVVQKNAQDWARDLRFSNQVNMQTMGVDTDRVTPQLLLASSNKLLDISRGKSEGDMKDSLQFQRFYGPVEYFAERIQKDGGSVARSMLWKATNRGNLDFIGAGSLQPHVNAVFHESNLSQFVDNSTPADGIDNSQKVTRIGEGGLSDEDSAPIEMRLVQPSYYGYVDPVRTAQKCYDEKTEVYTKKGWKSVTQMALDDEFAVLIDGKPSWSKPISLQSFDHDGLMYCFENSYINFCVTHGHRMYVSKELEGKYSIKYIDEIFGNSQYVLCGTKKASKVDENQKWFYLPKIEQKGTVKNVDKIDIVDFATFMGWYLSEGSCDITHSGHGSLDYRVRITQSPELHPEYYEEIRELVERLPFGAHPKSCKEATCSDITIKRKQLYFYLEQFGGSLEKFIPEWIFDAPTEARWAFVDAILKGDGSDQRDLNTISKRLAEDFARLMFELGQSVRITKQQQNYISRVTGKEVGPIYQVTWHKRYEHKLEASNRRKDSPSKGYYTEYYKGKVYCPTVPGGLVYVRRNNSKGFWCGNSPGITGYLTKNVLKGTDGKLYQKFINMKTGKLELVDAQTAAKKVVTTNEYLDSKDDYVYAIGGPRGLRVVKRSDVDYILPNSDDAFSASANTVPMISGIKAMRLLMGCHHPETPVVVVDRQGYTHIVPAKRVGHMGPVYVFGCDENGMDQLYPVRKVVTRVPARKSKFKKVILSSGRVLLTSAEHKWWVYDEKFSLKQAKELEVGDVVPRSLFSTMPVRTTEIMGTPITREICIFMGRLIRSLRVTSYSYRVEYVRDPSIGIDQSVDIITALEQLGIKNYNQFHSKGIYAVSIKDPVFQDWVDQNVGKLPEDRKIPSALLSLPQGYTSVFLDSYYKDLEAVGEDMQGDTWLLSIANPALRDSLSFMLNKIYTDTKYRDCTKKGFVHRALQLVPAEASLGDIVLEKITKILDVEAPPVMIDIDCDDNVYAVANGIITHNSKYISQAVPLQEREAPLVRPLDAATGMDMDTKMGKLLGTQWAPKAGMVKAVREDRIDMLYDDGTTGSVPLYKNFPANAKGWLTNYPKVKAGDKVSQGQLLATSNYTDDNGVAAMGRNLRMAYMSYHGGTYEDACIISQSAAKKMGYTIMYKTDMDKDKSVRTAKHLYTTWKPGKFTKEQLQNLDDQGVVKVGATINKGDPVILGIRTTEPSPGTLGKRILSDVTEVWEHANPGVVTDVVNGKNGIKVFATVTSPFKEGNKLSNAFGGKGTVAQIIPDEKMPRDAKGRPLELLYDPLGIVSRCYDEQTEFLTKEGWKFGKDVLDTDELLGWDFNTETFSFQPQQEPFYKKAYKGKMYRVSNEAAQLQVTPNHKVAYKWPEGEPKEGFIEDIAGKSCYLPRRDLSHDLNKETQWQFISSTDWAEVDYEGTVYCPTVSTGYVLTRRNGKELVAHNTNPSQMMEVGLGKVAMKTGKPIVVPAFMPKGQSRLKYVKDMMKANNVPWKEDVYDPETGRTIKNVFTGVGYYYPLKHIADTKMSARGTAQYTAQQVPMGGGEQGCFPAMQNIITLHGEQSIAHICEKKLPEYVMSWDEERKEWRWKQITDWFTYRAKVQNILNIFTENSLSIYGERCRVKHTNSSYPTKNHKMYMADGSIKLAGELKVGDYLAGIGCPYTEDQMQALYGTLMGDSCRTPDGGIQCMHSVKQSAYINYKRDIFAAVGASRVSEPKEVKAHIKQRDGRILQVSPSQAIRMQVPKSYYTQKALQLTTDSAGKRHLTIPVLEAMGEFGFCLWFLDDGSMHNHIKHKGKPQPQARIATHSFSVQEVEVAAKWLQKNLLHVENGTHITIYKGAYGQDQPCLDFRREASWEIARIVAKHIPWEVIPKSKMWLREYCKGVQEKTPCVKHNFMSPLGIVPLKIKEIKPYKHDKPNVTEVNVYDFTVEDTHNYALTGGVRVSNSKKIGNLEVSGLVGHNAFNFLHDAKLIRGQANSDFWRSIRTGQIPTVPGEPLAHKKFFAHLQGSGMQIKRDNEGFTIFALSNKDVNELAGSRQLKSTDTYEQKNFRPIAGGLFGQDIFGPNGDKWAYIQLDSPLPNPVMEEPLARLLGISDTQFQQIVRGKGTQKGLRNASDMKKVLSKMDLQKEANKALLELKTSTKSRKDKALKKYVAIARMRDAGVRPQEYMLDRIPVLPPKFRPISSHGGLTMIADSNYLYSQLLNARDDLREAKGLPEEYQEEGQSNLYQKWKELVGLYDPTDVKLKAKNVKGLLKWALGSTPKFSAYMTKVLGSTTDTVGRGVVIPSTKIKLNEVGLPVEMAWNIFAPFVTRKLVQQGYSPVDAMEQVKEKRPIAAEALAEVVKERPVVMNRAPSLHKLSLMGFNVKLTDGHALKVNPSIVSPYGMDFDGDSVKALVSIELQPKKLPKIGKWETIEDQKRSLTNKQGGCSLVMEREKSIPNITNQRKEQTMFKADTKMELVHTVMELSDLPVVEGSEVKKSDTVTEWDVQDGFYASTIDPQTREIVCAPITKVSKHTNLKMFDVKLAISSSYDHILTTSEDHSLITLNPSTLELEKTRPEDAKGRCVPVTRHNKGNSCKENGQGLCTEVEFPSGKYQMSYDMGLFFGLMVGDGWVAKAASTPTINIACCEPSLQGAIIELSKKANMPFTKEASLFSFPAGEGRFSKKDMQRLTFYMDQKDKVFIQELIGHGAENKKIPFLSFMASRAHMLGVLMGLLATDGVVSHRLPTGSKKSCCKNIAYHTISPVLRDGVQELAHRLGVKTSVTEYTGTTSGNLTYMINFCLEDMVRLYDSNKARFVVPVSYKQEAMERIANDFHENMKADCPRTWTSYDIVPFPRGLLCEFSWAKIEALAKDVVIKGRGKGFIKRCVAKRIADALERRDWSTYKDPTYIKLSDRTHRTPEQALALVNKWIAMVRNEDIGWEVVEDVTPSTCTEGWDCTVPGPYTFSLSTGTVVQDTVNIHVPVSKKAVQDVRQKMMPERNLISLRKGNILYGPEKAYTQGLYVATRMGDDKDVKTFASLADARKAYLKGQIDIDSPIVIKENNG